MFLTTECTLYTYVDTIKVYNNTVLYCLFNNLLSILASKVHATEVYVQKKSVATHILYMYTITSTVILYKSNYLWSENDKVQKKSETMYCTI